MVTKLPVHAIATALYSVAPERIFDAFLDTQLIGKFMFGPGVREETIVSLKNEPWVGGAFSYIVRRQGREFNHVGVYEELDRPSRMVFSWSVEQDPAGESCIVIEIASIIDGCEVTLTHEMPPGSEGFVEKAKIAWGKMLDKLTEVL